MANIRDFKQALQRKLDRKVDITVPYRAVLCDSTGLTSGTGSVWANQNTRLVWYLPIGGGQPAQVRCMRLEPVLGLGVLIGYADGSNELEVLSDDPFLRNSNATGGSFMTVTPADLQPGGRLQLWLYSKLFVPLAVYPGNGLSVSVAPGDYQGVDGSRKSFGGQNNFSIAAHQPAGPNQHLLVGISINTSGALVATAGATVSTAVTAPEPSWPADSVRLAVVELDDTQTVVSFAADVFDRRIYFPYPGPLNNYTATTDPTATDDTTAGYEPGSVWLNVTEHRAWINIISTENAAVWEPFGLGPLATLFLHSEASDIATYLSLLETPAEDAEEDDTATVNSAGGEVLIDAFATEAGGLGLTLLPGGAWQFLTYASVDSAVGVSSITIRVYKYETDTTETELFNVTTPEIDGLVATEYEVTAVQGDFALDPTDRLVVKYFAQTTSVVDRTVHLYYEGVTNYSHIHTPLSSSGGGGAPVGAQYVTLAADGSLTDERILTAGEGIGITDGGAGNAVTVSGGLITITNTSGGAVITGDCGYINSAGEYKEETTFGLVQAARCVVVTGGANNADIEVATSGLRAVRFAGTTPTAGWYAYTSTTAGLAEDYPAMWPGMFGIITDATGWSVAGDTCQVLLHCNTIFVPYTSSYYVCRVNSASTSDFVAKIDAAGTGGLTATNVPYDTISAGAANVIVPVNQGGSELGRMVLFNSTRGTERLITAVNTGTAAITTVSSVDTWADNDDITIQSQNCVRPSPPYFIDVDLSQQSEIPALARAIQVLAYKKDTGGTGQTIQVHPFETFNGQKQKPGFNENTSDFNTVNFTIPLKQRRFCWHWSASGAGTASQLLDVMGYWVAAP